MVDVDVSPNAVQFGGSGAGRLVDARVLTPSVSAGTSGTKVRSLTLAVRKCTLSERHWDSSLRTFI
jgi:hypothetical protein